MRAIEFQTHLENNLIPFWSKLRDEEYGGFYGYVDAAGKIQKESDKGVILNSRILWFYSQAYLLLRKPELLEQADHAYRFLVDHCIDSQYGGVYWSMSYDGRVCDDMKHTYNLSFAIYALSVYYEAGRRKDALNLAYELYRVIEEKCRDEQGYLEAFHRDFTLASNEKLSENGVLAERTMNTLLHILEAYTELYRADAFFAVGDSIRWILRTFRDKIYNPKKQICEVFFDRSYHTLLDLESYGHDIEASWLIERSCSVLNDAGYKKEMEPVIKGLAWTVYRNAFDKSQHALNNEREGKQTDRQKIWWVQAESVVGFYNGYQMEPQKKEYLQAAEEIWEFILQNMVDTDSGEWIESIGVDNNALPKQALVHSWKCPYHNGRMCMEMMHRLDR